MCSKNWWKVILLLSNEYCSTLILTNSEIAWKMKRSNISSGNSVPYCDSEIKNILSFNLLLNTQHFTAVVWRSYTMVTKVAL